MYGSLFGSFDSPAFDDFRLVENALDQLVGRFAPSAAIRAPQRAAFPPANVGATPERVDVYLFAAGVEPKGLDISIQQNLLIVSGSRNVPVDEQADYYRKERFAGEFRRVIALPEQRMALADVIFHETSTLGLRIYMAERVVQARRWVEVETPHGKVRIKVSERSFAPEYEDCRALARSTGVALKEIIAEANFAYLKNSR